MSTKISELPLDTDYALADYIPIVDSGGLITNRIRMSTLVTGSYGLSASFISLGGYQPATTGLIRAGTTAGNAEFLTIKYNGGTDYTLAELSAGNLIIGDTALGTRIDGGTSFILYGAPGGTITMWGNATLAATIGSNIVFSAPVTASLGVSGSHGSFGTGHVATTGLIRLANNDGIYFRNQANGADIAALFVNASNNVILGNGANGGAVQVYSEGITIDSRAQATLIQTSDQIVFSDRNTGQLKLKWLASNDTLTLANSGSTVTAYDGYLKGTDDKATMLTTPGSPSKAMYRFISGVNGKSYLVDTIITAQSTTTTGSLAYKLTGHFFMVGGVIGVVDAPYTILESANHTYLTASLTSSAGHIIVSGTQGASAETFRWGCFVRVQEQGA